jgi:hypothetical protein
MKAICILLVTAAGALASLPDCTPARLAAWATAVSAGSAAVVPAESLACIAANDLDPSGASAICSVVDASGAAIGAGFVVAEDVQAIAKLLSATAPKLPATVTLLEMAKGAAKSRKLAVIK